MNGVTVIGPQSLLRAGLVSLLGTIGFERIEEIDDIEHLRTVRATRSYEMLIILVEREEDEIVSALAEIRCWEPDARIVFVVPKVDLDFMIGCFAAGACGYLLDTISRDALLESLKLIDTGEKVFPSELASLFPILAAKLGSSNPSNSALHTSNLSRREIEILRCLSDGQSNKLIARNLKIAEATVKVHVKRILRKAHLLNRTQAALWAVTSGIVLAA